MKLKILILNSLLVFTIECNRESSDIENEPGLNKIKRTMIEEISVNTDSNFSLSEYPEMQGVFSINGTGFRFLDVYFSKELHSNGKESGFNYNSEDGSNCAEISNATNSFRFRYSGEKFDLHLKFISKKGDDYFLTNRSQDQLLRMQILDIGKHYKSDIVQALEYNLFSMENKKVAHGTIYTDFTSYEECLKERGAIADGIKGMSKDDLSP